ncbi:Cut8-domain-containing protein [Aureobasidium sp. EXF-12298]|nr:Cut8-domain-containing protein [Aureobasidium sp. EXF-12298]KAI4755098.1 Cut8-domain-containing protein [Aureobasidium sp. EXF-12344]KAI4779605.1 Cut8-domain-containing protein [Aureobasidium sp. EXF-3400]
MNSVITSNPLFAPHLLGTPRPSPSRSEGFGSDRMSSRKRKASEDDLDDRMSASPTNSPAVTGRQLFPASRSTKRSRTVVAAGRPLDLPRLLETLSPDEMRNLLQNICDQNPAIAHEVVTKAPRPSIESTLSVLQKYETTFKESFPFGNRPSSDYTYNRVRQPMLQLIEALKDFTPHFLPPNEPQPTLSLQYLDAVTQIIHRLPTWDTFQHNHAKFEAYDELAQAWALAIRESAKRGGGFHLQYAGWDQKLLKHNEESGGRLQDAVNELRANVTYLNGPAAGGAAPSNFDERAAIRQQILSGTYGPDVSVGPTFVTSSSTTFQYFGRCVKSAASTESSSFFSSTSSSTFASLVITSITSIMAIIPDVPHVVVDIVVDGHSLPEYLDEDDDDSVSPDSTIKYVECVSGSHFGIRVDLTGMEFKHLKRGNSLITDYYLDGQVVACAVHRFPLGHQAVTTRPAARYRENGTWKERSFMFADLVTSEEGLSNKSRPDPKDLGTITVKLFYAHSNWSREAPFLDFPKVNVGQEVVHEKNLKGQAISNQAKLGEEVALGHLSTVDSRRLGNAFAEFQFRYRSRSEFTRADRSSTALTSTGDLQTLYLIPRSPSPVPLEDRPEETLNREELLELLRRQKARQEQNIAIKQELKRERTEDGESDNDQIVISSRPPAKQLKISTDADTGIDTIDLTDA